MTELTPAPPPGELVATLDQRQKAAVIIGALGVDAAGPILEMLDETALRNFAGAMSKLRKVKPETVEATIREFVHELEQADSTVRGGINEARDMLEQFVNNETLSRIMDDVDMPSVHNVWRKLATVDDQALAEFLSREHPQTAAVVLSKLTAEQAARILGRVAPDRAREIVLGITKTSSLDGNVIEAIGDSVSKDFLATQAGDANGQKPVDRIGAIMNYVTTEIRTDVLGHLDSTQPEFSEEVKKRMFTFEDIHERVERRDISAVVRAVEQDTLLKALGGAREHGQASREFILSSISSRVAEQLREELADYENVRTKDAEEAQTAVIKAIRTMERAGELKLVELDE